MNQKLQWVPLSLQLSQIQWHNDIAEVTAGEKLICIARRGEGYFAFAHKCPHAGGYFKDGFVDALCNIVCPLHHYRFSLKNGHNTTGEGYKLQRWPVQQKADVLLIGFPSGNIQ